MFRFDYSAQCSTRLQSQASHLLKPVLGVFRFNDLPTELRMAVCEQMYRGHIRTGFDWYNNNQISIVHPGARKMTVVKFRH